MPLPKDFTAQVAGILRKIVSNWDATNAARELAGLREEGDRPPIAQARRALQTYDNSQFVDAQMPLLERGMLGELRNYDTLGAVEGIGALRPITTKLYKMGLLSHTKVTGKPWGWVLEITPKGRELVKHYAGEQL